MAKREDREIRKQLSGPEAAPYMGRARLLLGQMKEQMQMGGLSQLQWVKDYTDGLRIIVTSVFGQDKINISVPVKRGVSKAGGEEFGSFEPYLWVGVRKKSPVSSVGLYLFVWEPDNPTHDVYQSNSIVSYRYNTGTREGNANYPLGDPAWTGGVAHNDNQVISYNDYIDEQGVTWNYVVVADSDGSNPKMRGFESVLVDGDYKIGVCTRYDDCTDNGPTEVEIKVVAGKGVHEQSETFTFTVSKYTAYERAIFPYGYFGDTWQNPDCPSAARDYGENPHTFNWKQETIQVSMPGEQKNVPLKNLKVCSISETEELPHGFNPASGFPTKGQRCPKTGTKIERLKLKGLQVAIVREAQTIHGGDCLSVSEYDQTTIRTYRVRSGTSNSTTDIPLPWTLSNSAGHTFEYNGSPVDLVSETETCLSHTTCLSGFSLFAYYIEGCEHWTGAGGLGGYAGTWEAYFQNKYFDWYIREVGGDTMYDLYRAFWVETEIYGTDGSYSKTLTPISYEEGVNFGGTRVTEICDTSEE